MTTQNVNALSPVGYLNTVTGHLWSLTEQPEAIMRSGLYEPLVLSREALEIAQQKDALQLSVDNILRGLGITGDSSVTQLVLEKFIALQAKCDALAAENVARKDLVEQHAGCFSVCPNCSHEEPSETDDVVWMSRKMETPATDAAIAEIKLPLAAEVDAYRAFVGDLGVIHSMKAPETDRLLGYYKARGVDELATNLWDRSNELVTEGAKKSIVIQTRVAAKLAEDFADNLRAGRNE